MTTSRIISAMTRLDSRLSRLVDDAEQHLIDRHERAINFALFVGVLAALAVLWGWI